MKNIPKIFNTHAVMERPLENMRKGGGNQESTERVGERQVGGEEEILPMRRCILLNN